MITRNGIVLSKKELNEKNNIILEVFSYPSKYLVYNKDIIKTSKYNAENLVKFTGGKRININQNERRDLLRKSCQKLSIQRIPKSNVTIDYTRCAVSGPNKCKILKKALRKEYNLIN